MFTNRHAKRLVQRLAHSRKSIVTAESLTGGLIASHITAVSGSSAVFSGGYITYSDQAKISLLGIDPQLIDRYTAVSAETAQAMAKGALAASRSAFLASADIALAVTGFAGPTGGTPENPVGTVYIACACRANESLAGDYPVRVRRIEICGSRERVRRVTVQAALLLALQTLDS